MIYLFRWSLTLFMVLAGASCFAQSGLPTSFQPYGISGGGYTYSPSISPNNSNVIFLVCDMGGLYRSIDGGRKWDLISCNEIISSVKGKVQFTNDPNIMYVIGRSTNKSLDPWFRGAIFKSVDAGITWVEILDPSSSGVHKLLVDPNDGNRMLVNEYNKLFFTSNGGISWNQIFTPNNNQIWLAGAVWNGNQIIVGTDHGLLVSNDDGSSFNIENHSGLPINTGMMQLSGSVQSGAISLFCIPVDQSELYAWNEPLSFKTKVQGCFKMDYSNNGIWTEAKANIPQDVLITDIVCNNTELNLIYASGSINNSVPVIYKSQNSAQSWQSVFKALNNENIRTGWGGDGFGAFSYLWSGSFLGFEVSDSNPNIVIGSDGMGHISYNGGIDWQAIYVDETDLNDIGNPTQKDKLYKSAGLNVTTTHQVYFNGLDEIIAANTDIGMTFSPNKGEQWSFERNLTHPWGSLSSNNWYRIVKETSSGHLYAAVSNINDIYLSYRISDEAIEPGGYILTSIDAGVTWDTLYNFGYPVVWLEIDKTNINTMYASVVDFEEGGIYKSTDSGVNWFKLNSPPRTEGHPYNIISLKDGGLLVTFSARSAPGESNLTESSGVFYSTDGGNTWLDRTATSMKFYTKDIIVDPNDLSENTWYTAVWGRYSVWPGNNNDDNGGLYRTTDRGQNWVRIFKNESVESMTFDPSNPNLMLIACENDGLYYSDNIHDANPSFSKLTQFPFWRPKRIFYNPYNLSEIWVTTMGGGLYVGSKEISTNSNTIINKLESIDIYPNPILKDQNFLNIRTKDSLAGIRKVSLTDSMGKLLLFKLIDDKVVTVNINTQNLSSGIYILSIEMDNGTIFTQKVIKQ